MMQNPQLSASLFRALTTACKEEESLSSWPEWVFLAKYRAKRRIFSPKNWKKQNWSILEDIGKYHFFQATGLLVLGVSSWWKSRATCFPGCFKWCIFIVVFYKIATRKLFVELMDFFGILRRTQIGTSTITVNQINKCWLSAYFCQVGARSSLKWRLTTLGPTTDAGWWSYLLIFSEHLKSYLFRNTHFKPL